MNLHDIIRQPRLTEKAVFEQAANNAYTFEVAPGANRGEIKDAIEKLFNVKVQKVRTMNYSGKQRRVGASMGLTRSWKKAIVTLADGQQIEEA